VLILRETDAIVTDNLSKIPGTASFRGGRSASRGVRRGQTVGKSLPQRQERANRGWFL